MQGDVAKLALNALRQAFGRPLPWSNADAATVRQAAARLIRQDSDAAVMLGQAAGRLMSGIPLVSYLPRHGGPFGPGWTAHPFGSPAMAVGYKLREADLTRELASLMGTHAGWRGPQRALSFLRVLADLVGQTGLNEALKGAPRPAVYAEHMVAAPTRRLSPKFAEGQSGPTANRLGSPSRIDLLFEWPVGTGGQRAVVVIEAKLGAVVAPSQLLPYNREAVRRARGGPITRVLLTVRPDAAEQRHRSWLPVRWFALMRRWEALLAEAGDDDAEFARVRAHVWTFLFQNRGLATK